MLVSIDAASGASSQSCSSCFCIRSASRSFLRRALTTSSTASSLPICSIKPHSYARRASIGSPVRTSQAARPEPMSRGSSAAWLVLTGEAIDARRALEWGLIEEIGDGAAVLEHLLAGEPRALRMQKQLLQLWDEAPLATSIAASIEAFARAHSRT